MELPAALFFNLIGNLNRQSGGFGPIPPGIGEDMYVAKPRLFNEVKTVLPFLPGFAGKAGNNIGGDIKVGNL